jgi:hypothetical protein
VLAQPHDEIQSGYVPVIAMVDAAEHRLCDDAANSLDLPRAPSGASSSSGRLGRVALQSPTH